MDNEKTTPGTVETPEAPVEEKKCKKHGKSAELEKKLAAKEEEIASLNEQLADPATAADYEKLTALTAQLDEKNNELLEQMELWETTQLELESLTAEG